MKTVTQARSGCKASDSAGLAPERAYWLLAHLKGRAEYFYLNGPTYRYMSLMHGFSKRELDRAVVLLRDQGLVELDGLCVLPIEEPACPGA